MNYREFYNRKNSFNPLTYQGDNYYEAFMRSLPKEAFIQNTPKKVERDPYVEDVFNLKPYLKECYYDCKVPRNEGSVDNPIDQYNVQYKDYVNGQPIEDPNYYSQMLIQTRLSIYHLINLFRHNIVFEFIKEEDLKHFYQALQEFLDLYYNRLKQSRTYVNISTDVIGSIEGIVNLLKNNYEYIINPPQSYQERFAGYNPLMAMNYQRQLEAMNPQTPNVRSYNINNFQQPISNVQVYKVNFNNDEPRVQRVKEEYATPNLFHDKNCKKVKF